MDKPTDSKPVTESSNLSTPAKIITVNTGILGMVGYDGSFTVRCFGDNCEECSLRFKCYTTRPDEEINIWMEEWFKVKPKIVYTRVEV